jgi:hypothetical protein
MTEELISLQGALFAEFDEPELARGAYIELRTRGYGRLETYSPFPITPQQAHQPGGWPTFATFVFALGFVGAAVGYLVQWYANVRAYALNIGGRPTHAVLAFVLPSFEALVLFAALASFFGLLIVLRLPRLWRPVFEIDGFERAGIDRYWVVVGLGSGGGDLARTTRELEAMRAVRVIHVVGES